VGNCRSRLAKESSVEDVLLLEPKTDFVTLWMSSVKKGLIRVFDHGESASSSKIILTTEYDDCEHVTTLLEAALALPQKKDRRAVLREQKWQRELSPTGISGIELYPFRPVWVLCAKGCRAASSSAVASVVVLIARTDGKPEPMHPSSWCTSSSTLQ
jgi:hypothetical protein